MRYGSNFPIVGYVGQDANGYLLSSQRNGLRVPAYARLDLHADRTFTYRKSRLTLFLEVVNATNRDNYRPNSPGMNTGTRRVFESARKSVSVVAGGGSVDRVLMHSPSRCALGPIIISFRAHSGGLSTRCSV